METEFGQSHLKNGKIERECERKSLANELSNTALELIWTHWVLDLAIINSNMNVREYGTVHFVYIRWNKE